MKLNIIKKSIKLIKRHGIVNINLYILKKSLKKYSLYKFKKKYQKNIVNFKFLDNFTSQICFYNSMSNQELIRSFYNNNSKLKDEIINQADKILEHKFNLLGSGESNLGKSINWNQDFKSNFIWNNDFYTKIKIIDLNNFTDVKIPWELSRFQHLFTLGKAYWISENEKYYQEFKEEILDWIEKNPVNTTVNWTCAMDVAIRAINWIFGYFLFEDIVKRDKEFLRALNNSLYFHGIFIFNNLEKGLELANNHYLSNLNGLIFLGLYFNNLNKETKKWLKFGIKELEREMFIQNNVDGSNYETSTSYHRLVTELMFYPSLLLEKNNLTFSNQYKKRLEKMFEFMAFLTKDNGKIPLIGDVDNGRLVILSEYPSWDVNDCRGLISLGGEYFNNAFLQSVGTSIEEDKLWIFSSLKKYKKQYNKKSVSFKEGGYYLLKNDRIYCLIRCGELSLKGQGGHSHNDQLAIELNVDGEDFFIDTGTGVYTANKNIRNLFRSTKMHNTVEIKNIEQNKFEENKLFEMKEESFGKCFNFDENIFIGEHYGFLTKNKSIHKREVRLYDRRIEIKDYLKGYEGIINLHLDKDVNIVSTTSTEIILEKNNKKIKLNGIKNNYKIKETLLSPKYGEIIESKKIVIFFKDFNILKIFL